MDIKDDFAWLLPYGVGRVTVLGSREVSWAKRAIWIASALSVIGTIEVFVLGPAPRTLLYTTLTDEKGLGTSAYATGFGGLRESSTMSGPLEFGALCMVVLVIWWTFHPRALSGVLLGTGLVLSVTRSAWIGTVVVLAVLAIQLRRKRLFLIVSTVVLLMFSALASILGFTRDYWDEAISPQESSAEGHISGLESGMRYLEEHPLGSGTGTVGWRAVQTNANAPLFESTYLQFAAEYGITAVGFFLGFQIAALQLAWRSASKIGYAAVGILVGFSIMMTVLLMHSDFPLACWVWFPVGLAVRHASSREHPDVGQRLPNSRINPVLAR